MGKKGKEDEISNLMHVTVVRDATLPQHTKTSTALVWRHVTDRYWELEMARWSGFNEFNFFRAINPGLSCGVGVTTVDGNNSEYGGYFEKENIPGIVIGNKTMFDEYKALYEHVYLDMHQLKKEYNQDTDEDVMVPNGVVVPPLRSISTSSNKMISIEDMSGLRGMYLKVERNIEGFNLLTGINSAEELIESRQTMQSLLEKWRTPDEPWTFSWLFDEADYVDWDKLNKKVKKRFISDGLIPKKKPSDTYLKNAGVYRWWPQGRGHAKGSHDSRMKVTFNQMEHFSVEWKVYDGNYTTNFHMFFKQLNELHKELKRKGLGGFWKDPMWGYVSVDPKKCGTMFECSISLKVVGIAIYFTNEEIINDCRSVLGIIATFESRSPSGKVFCLSPAETHQWLPEDEQFNLLLTTVNRLSQLDRSLCYSPREEGDTLFDLKAFRPPEN